MKKIIIPFLFLLLPFTFSCDELDSFTGLTDSEIVEGLKAALNVGTDNSVVSASATDGYLKHEVIKILLPPEVQSFQNKIETGSINLGILGSVSYTTILDAYVQIAPNLKSNPFDELTIAMNRGAEQAAVKAKPIFIDAVTSMSIADGLTILQGDSTAATKYFQNSTSSALITAFQPDVANALGDTQANAIYSDIVGFLNHSYTFVGLTFQVRDYLTPDEQLPATLDAYATEKAVGGLFHLVGDEERKIRKDPFAWASDIIAKVFGSAEAKGG